MQDKVQALIKSGKWEEVFLEKINVLLSMRQVLETCFDMLEKTSSPMDGRTLQNILRCAAASFECKQRKLSSSMCLSADAPMVMVLVMGVVEA